MLQRIEFFLTEAHRLTASQLPVAQVVQRLRDHGLVEQGAVRTWAASARTPWSGALAPAPDSPDHKPPRQGATAGTA